MKTQFYIGDDSFLDKLDIIIRNWMNNSTSNFVLCFILCFVIIYFVNNKICNKKWNWQRGFYLRPVLFFFFLRCVRLYLKCLSNDTALQRVVFFVNKYVCENIGKVSHNQKKNSLPMGEWYYHICYKIYFFYLCFLFSFFFYTML